MLTVLFTDYLGTPCATMHVIIETLLPPTYNVAGVVVQVGPSVSGIKYKLYPMEDNRPDLSIRRPGDRVTTFTGTGVIGSLDGSAFQNYTISKPLTTSKLTGNISFSE
jgi:hypothetical protein